MRPWLALLLVLMIVPGWSGDERLAVPGDPSPITAERVMLHPGRPGVRRTGDLVYLGGVALANADSAFGGFSSLLVEGDRFTLLSDGGTLARFRMGDDWWPRDLRLDALPAGPGTGWRKLERDSEAMTIDPLTRRTWVAFEHADAIWRYAPGFVRGERGRAPPAMARWPDGGGAEAMTRLRDGRFLVISESKRPRRGRDGRKPPTREGLIFAGDPANPATRVERFSYRPEPGYSPVDIAELPDGGLLVLERGFVLPFRWRTRIALVGRGAVRAGAVVAGRTLARLRAPMIHDNFEGITVAREGGATIIWLVSDDNQFVLQRSLLLKFRIDR